MFKRRNYRRNFKFNFRKRKRFLHKPPIKKLDISKYIQKPVEGASTEEYKPKNLFSDFGFCPKLENNLKQRKYRIPTPIQDQAIKPILENRDLIGLANTGTGKTAAFLLPLIERAFRDKREKVLIIAPTRELAIQINKEFRDFSGGLNLYSAICVGGNPIRKQIFDLRRNHNFVIGTPGRLKDLFKRKVLKLNLYQNIVLDEVDRMLDMGFIDEIKIILNELPQERKTFFFSATLPQKIKNLTSQFLKDPVMIKVKTKDIADNISQDIIRVNRSEKFNKLKDLLRQPEFKKVLVFTETKKNVEKLAFDLSRNGLKSASIHGDKKQSQRQKSLLAFKKDYCKILVATDLAARGLDINNISHVINYTLPKTYDDYIHRVGRTGRALKFGQALTFID